MSFQYLSQEYCPLNKSMFAKVVEASRSLENGSTLYTVHVRAPRIIWSEMLTHRTFCLSGDAMLDFDLPKNHHNGSRRIHQMSLREFADKWMNGAAAHKSPAHNGKTLNALDNLATYTAKDIALELGFTSALNLNALCRIGKIKGAFKSGGKWAASGASWKAWREATGTRRYNLRSRLSKMNIRQINERTGEVITSTVKDCIASGTKEVFRVSAGDYSVSGSKDHRIFTEAGWKRIEEIVPGMDKVITYRYGTGPNADPNRYNKIGGRWVQTWARQNKDAVAAHQNGLCAVSGDPLEASFHLHHKEPRHLRPDLAFNLDNVIAVNPSAHSDLHETQGWQIGVPLGTQAVLVDAVVSEGMCDTYDLEIAGEFPNFFADGVVVHNSRNARSSRAVPVKTMLNEVRNDPFVPWHWTGAKPGMQGVPGWNEKVLLKGSAGNFVDSDRPVDPTLAWLHGRDMAADLAESFLDAGYHKQIANRLLEPFSWIDGLITSAQWNNFFHLRDHSDAEDHFQDLARCMEAALSRATVCDLEPGEWHLPYVTREDQDYARSQFSNWDEIIGFLRKISSARCARISYAPFDNNPGYDRELERYDLLVKSSRVHASPLEHQATPDTRSMTETRTFFEGGMIETVEGYAFDNGEFHGNLPGWIQNRHLVNGHFVHG